MCYHNGGFGVWPEAVQFLLRTYAKNLYIERFAAEMDSLTQDGDEDERAFAERLQTKARYCSGVYSEQDLITSFIWGLKPNLQPLLSLSTFDPDKTATLMDYAEHATAQGDARRALAPSRLKKDRIKSKRNLLKKTSRSGRRGSAQLVYRGENQIVTSRRDAVPSTTGSRSPDSSSDEDSKRRAVAMFDYGRPEPPSISTSPSAGSSESVQCNMLD